MSIENDIQNLFVKRNLTLALAESCTGGAVSHLLVNVPGASNYFLGSIVAYSNSSKESLLGVSRDSLESKGAVSAEVATQMAQGALKKFDAHFSLATTGIAGPEGGNAQKPVGTVFFALAQKHGKIKTWQTHFSAPREEIIKKSTIHALEELFKFVNSL